MPQFRIAIGRLIIFTAMLCGAVAAYLTAYEFALSQATSWMDEYAQLTVAKENASIAEAHSALNILNNSTYPSCSDKEIAAFRELVFRSDYLKDAGRIHDNKIECSATAGRSAGPVGTMNPKFRLEDGTIVSSDPFPSQENGPKRNTLQLGDAYVIFATKPPLNLAPVPVHLTVTTNGAAEMWQDLPGAGGAPGGRILHQPAEGIGRVIDNLYSTRCTALYISCVMVSASIHEVQHGQKDLLASSSVAGGLAGILLGMGLSFLYERHRELSHQLRRALRHNKLRVVYQPVVNLETRQIVGAEALARWTDEDGNEVTPDVFVKLAEEQGFVGGITKVVLRHILRDFAITLRDLPGFRISMNVAAADLSDPAFLHLLQESLQRAGVCPESLIIEITERSAADSAEAMETLQKLRRMGHSIHIDDFGTGYSNLDKLLYLCADTIKIDKAFTGVIGTESAGATILPQILQMAKSLNLEVVVEGIETVHQADYFSVGEQKIYVQGWLYGRPMTAEQFVGVLAGDGDLGFLATPEAALALTTKPGALRLVGTMTA